MIKEKKYNTSEKEYNEKIQQLKSTIESYKKELTNLLPYKVERNLFHGLSTIFASAETFDDLFKRTIDMISQQLKARYYGVFWLNSDKEMFEYRYGRGYKAGLFPGIPRVGSLMGKCIFKKDILWIPETRSISDYIPLNQEPIEYNLLCVPIILFGLETGVIRLANIDQGSVETANKILKTIYPLLCSSLERMQLQQQNKQALRGMEASFTIARLLENTLVEGDILNRVGSQIPKLFDCQACLIAMKNEKGVKFMFSWPPEFYLGGNPHSGMIYLRNLLEAYPSGKTLIKDVHSERRWSWPKSNIQSLCMVGLHHQKFLRGVIIVLGPKNLEYSISHQNLLGLVAAQTSITLERASYFRKQESLASHDGLTGLLNHRMFQETLKSEMERSKRYKCSLSLIMFDIDNFKKFNDLHGHQIGDEVLKMVALTMKSMMRITDKAFRYGGEEFCVILPETSSENTMHFAERLRKRIEINRTVRKLSVTISIGVTEYIISETPELFIKRADELLYKSKKSGKNKITLG
jgi:diguanylate cyclase (GGDEF)-like protein